MTGKTYTNQDLTLGCVITQELPAQAMPGFEKQFLIDNKPITRDILEFAFFYVSDIRDAMKELEWIPIWSSETLAEDPFANNKNLDAIELGFRLEFSGLKLSVTAVLQFMRNVAGGYKKVVRVAEYDYEEMPPFLNTQLTITLEQLISSTYSRLFTNMMREVRNRIAAIQVLEFDTAWEHEENETIYNFRTTAGALSFYEPT